MVAAPLSACQQIHIFHPAGEVVKSCVCVCVVGGGEHVHVFVQEEEHFIVGYTSDIYFAFGVIVEYKYEYMLYLFVCVYVHVTWEFFKCVCVGGV